LAPAVPIAVARRPNTPGRCALRQRSVRSRLATSSLTSGKGWQDRPTPPAGRPTLERRRAGWYSSAPGCLPTGMGVIRAALVDLARGSDGGGGRGLGRRGRPEARPRARRDGLARRGRLLRAAGRDVRNLDARVARE